MADLGLFALFLGFVASVGGAVALAASAWRARPAGRPGETLSWAGRLCAFLAFGLLAFCCGLIVFCLFTGDNSIEYVARNRSDAQGALSWLYTLAGLWAGRQGSLLLWAWLVSAFACANASRRRADASAVDDGALAIMLALVAAFAGTLLFGGGNGPFDPTPAVSLDASGALVGGAELWGMNSLLEHWAMAVHPPALFLGYAGLAVPFAYAAAAALLGDESDLWARRAQAAASIAWLFLGLGIGLGALWAYTVLGWGGYWGWDAVENASLAPWLCAAALVHSLAARRRGAYLRWAPACACLAFMFVLVGSLIARSGLVQSVHAFDADAVSATVFGVLIALVAAAALFCLAGRRRPRALPPAPAVDAAEAERDAAAGGGSATSGPFGRDMALYLLNLLLVAAAFLLCYLTVAPALPAPLPLAGLSASPAAYGAIARPLTVFLVFLVAACPLLGWARADRASFARRARVPAALAAVLFAALLACFATTLLPAYDAALAAGGAVADDLRAAGPAWWYHGTAIAGFAAASLAVLTAACGLARSWRAAGGVPGRRPAAVGAAMAHASLGVLLVGLIGSSMYATEASGYLAPVDGGVAADAPVGGAAALSIDGYELAPVDEAVRPAEDGIVYALGLSVERGGREVARIEPAVYLDKATLQQRVDAAVLSMPSHDLFVAYRGVDAQGRYAVEARVSPLISCVWLGFALLMAGTAIAACAHGPRRTRGRDGGAA